MRTVGSEFMSGAISEVTTLATLWKLTLSNNEEMFFTDHDQDIVVGSDTYKASSGFSPSSVESKNNMDIDNLDILGILDSDNITRSDLLSGKYDYAKLLVYMCNYAADNKSNSLMLIRKGILGEVSIKSDQFSVEVRGMADLLQKQIGRLYTPSCSAILGDNKCAFDMSENTWYNGTQTGFPATSTGVVVSSVENRSIFVCEELDDREYGFYIGGEVLWSSGDNEGLSMEIKDFTDSGEIVLVLPMPYDIQENDVLTIKVGCDKTIGSCSTKFNNAQNFRGFPHVPGIDKMLETSGTK